MTNKQIELWNNSQQNAEIQADSSVIFGTEISDFENKRKYGSMNFLVLSNRSGSALQIKLDNKIYAEIPASSTMTISAEEGTYFDFIAVKELNSAIISAGLITIRYGRANEV